MNARRLGSALSCLASAGFLGTAWIHGTGYDSAVELSATGSKELQALVPALWISFSFNLVVIALMMIVVAVTVPRSAAILLFLAALCPFSAAALQVYYLGFIPPTAILLGIGTMALLAGFAFSAGGGRASETAA